MTVLRYIPFVVLVHVVMANDEIKWTCKDVTGTDWANCICVGPTHWVYIACPNLNPRITIIGSDGNVFVRCDQPITSTLTLPSLRFGSVKNLTVHDCQSAVTARDITDRLGINSVERLKVKERTGTLGQGKLSNLKNVSEVHLIDMALTHLDPAWFGDDITSESSVQKLFLGNCNITELDERVFKHLTNVTEINLKGNLLSDLQDGLFVNNSKLTVLNLDSNRLENIKSKLLSRLEGLMYLHLSQNLLTALPVGLLDNNTRLIVLDLSYNRLESIPSKLLSGHDNLQNLYISQNLLTSVPEGLLDNTTALTRLDLSHNRLESLPRDLFKSLTKLKILDLYNNRLKEMSSDFSMLPRFVSIDMSENSLSSLEALDIINNCSRVFKGKDGSKEWHRRRLILSNNNITSLDLSSYKTEPSNNTVVSVILDNNPLICDCHLHPLVQIVHNSAKVYFDNAPVEFENSIYLRCVAPSTVKGRVLSELSLEELTCP